MFLAHGPSNQNKLPPLPQTEVKSCIAVYYMIFLENAKNMRCFVNHITPDTFSPLCIMDLLFSLHPSL